MLKGSVGDKELYSQFADWCCPENSEKAELEPLFAENVTALDEKSALGSEVKSLLLDLNGVRFLLLFVVNAGFERISVVLPISTPFRDNFLVFTASKSTRIGSFTLRFESKSRTI